jgi:FkbM family methyltransferase
VNVIPTVDILGRLWNHPGNASAKLSGVARYVNWQIHKRCFRRNLPFKYHGFMLPGFRDSHSMSAAYYFSGYPDWWEMRFMQDYLRPGDRFLDVGANVGLYSIFAAALVGVDGQVDAFEPASIPANRLQQAIELNQLDGRINVHRLAVSDKSGSVEFGFAADDCQSHVRRNGEEAGDSISVPAVRLDEYCAGRTYAMAKFDIEGHEPLALSGASGMLANGNPRVMQIEMAGYSKLFGVPTSEFVQRLADVGYDCFCYDPTSKRLLVASRPWEMQLDNVIAIHREAKSIVEDRLATNQRTFV